MRRKTSRSNNPTTGTYADDALSGDYKVLLREVLDKATELARAAGENGLDDIDDLIADCVEGYARMSLEDKRVTVRKLLADAEALAERAPTDLEVLEKHGEWLDQQALGADAEYAEAQIEIEASRRTLAEQLGKYAKLPLLVRGSARFALITAPATAAGLGVLVKLGLGALDDQQASWALVIAAVLGALGAEAVLGLLGAELYERLRPERRPRALLTTFIVILLTIFTTEGFAVFARQQGVDATNAGPQINADGTISSTAPATPSLIWTGPLSILLTLAGAGALGARNLRDGTKPRRDRIKAAKVSVKKAEGRKQEAKVMAETLRGQANDARLRGAAKLAEAKAAHARGPIILDALSAETEKHTQIARVAKAEAMLRYYIARNTPAPPKLEPASRTAETTELVLGSVGAALVASAIAAVAGAAAPVMLGVGGAVLAAAMVAARLARNPQRAATKGLIS